MACSEPPKPAAIASRLADARALAAPAKREWRVYLGDEQSSQSSLLAQVTRANVDQLEVAWTYDSADEGLPASSDIQHNPLVVKGVLYATSASKRLFALNASSGAEIWSFVPPDRSSMANRGVTYWEDAGDERILYVAGHYLYAVDARTGLAINSFGDEGRVDISRYLLDSEGEAKVDTGFFGATSPGIVYDDVLILGSRVHEVSGAAPGHIRAFDVRSGELRWRFRTIPAAGDPGADSWPLAALETVGGANAWAGFSLDSERGLVFAATGSAAYDFYGADRAGDNLYANSVLALDAATGAYRWHYQVVRHDLWDRDLPAPPNLVQLKRDGAELDAVAQVTKSGHVFVLDRDTGVPLFPVDEVHVTGVPLPGEAPAASQPLPRLPQAFTRQQITEQDLAKRPSANPARVKESFLNLQHSGPFTLPSIAGTLVAPGFDGGAEWGGAAWDAATGTLFINANEMPSILQMRPSAATDEWAMANPRAIYQVVCAICHGVDRSGYGTAGPSLLNIGDRLGPVELYSTISEGRGRMPGFGSLLGKTGTAMIMLHLYTAADEEETEPTEADIQLAEAFFHRGYQNFLGADGLPAITPPWGTLNAIDLNSGELRWQVPLGNYPLAQQLGIENAGAQNYGGPVVTAGGLVFIAASPDARIHAYAQSSGELLWEHELPQAGFATPSVYEANGRQFIVIAAGGGKLGQPSGSHYVAFALPATTP